VGEAAAGRADALVMLIPRSAAGVAVACADRCRARRVRAAFFAGAAGAAVVATGAAAAAPYIDVPVDWTMPGLIVIPCTVA
jgi:ABC-type Co2+ transport system permease subunit